ncbi:MAG: hypothetical protein K2I24_03555, partial [Duncaniella sp.]|nr:hypothetical protein [Duncaniella sp.]
KVQIKNELCNSSLGYFSKKFCQTPGSFQNFQNKYLAMSRKSSNFAAPIMSKSLTGSRSNALLAERRVSDGRIM